MNLVFHERLKVALDEMRQRRIITIVAGCPQELYWQSVGYCRALHETLEEAEEIRKRLTE